MYTPHLSQLKHFVTDKLVRTIYMSKTYQIQLYCDLIYTYVQNKKKI